jgi:hypothetical protein
MVLIEALSAPELYLPKSTSLVNIKGLDTTLNLFVRSENFLSPAFPGHEAYNCPCLAFLITNQATNRRVLFDAGARTDYWNYSPATAGKFQSGVNVKGFKVDKGVHEVLQDGDIKLETLESVIWR